MSSMPEVRACAKMAGRRRRKRNHLMATIVRPSGGRGRYLSLRFETAAVTDYSPLPWRRREGTACAQSICTVTGKIHKFVDFLIVVQLIQRLDNKGTG